MTAKNTTGDPKVAGGSGADEDRTHNLLNAIQALSQLSYRPKWEDGKYSVGLRADGHPRRFRGLGDRRARGPDPEPGESSPIPPGTDRPGVSFAPLASGPVGGRAEGLPGPIGIAPTDLPTGSTPMSFGPQIALYTALIVAASLLGGMLPAILRLGHRGLQLSLSFVAGVMLGVALFHLLPHAVMIAAEAGGKASHSTLDPVMLAAVVGFATLFLLERFFHFHQHEPVETPEAECHDCGGHHHDHRKAEAATRATAKPSVGVTGGPARLGWVGAIFGLGVHSLLEGVALAASLLAASEACHEPGHDHAAHADALAWAGLATFLVIVLHKPFDAMTLTALMRHAGKSRKAIVIANLLLAALVPAGIGLFLAGVAGRADTVTVTTLALAFSAGMFLCIASSDLLPELQFHRHDRIKLSLSLLAGIGLAFTIARFEAAAHEAAHAHDHGPAPAGDAAHDHSHDHSHDHAHPH